eukprot:CAMPEP_0175120760 /NCGR_PEP_ID=MMETSP0087-20121206/797_1 /TAXON_ID=136419 /ORGANISM="Unknown Unknown, Strain D1" /LENGTH=254 /DNA_ID=CAMNT_0016402237 /DNA_START=176 /DNA_END=940 /DNA_ORIENTATION=-
MQCQGGGASAVPNVQGLNYQQQLQPQQMQQLQPQVPFDYTQHQQLGMDLTNFQLFGGVPPSVLSVQQMSALNSAYLSQSNSKEYCCIHRKERNVASLVPIAPGEKGLRCKPDDECKIGSTGQDFTLQACSVHGKTRSTSFMTQKEDGQWCCKPDSQCMQPNTSAKQLCGEHSKMRALDALQADGENRWVCKPGNRCKGTGGAATRAAAASPYGRSSSSRVYVCALHNKKRGARYLVPHQTIPGAMQCTPDDVCK